MGFTGPLGAALKVKSCYYPVELYALCLMYFSLGLVQLSARHNENHLWRNWFVLSSSRFCSLCLACLIRSFIVHLYNGNKNKSMFSKGKNIYILHIFVLRRQKSMQKITSAKMLLFSLSDNISAVYNLLFFNLLLPVLEFKSCLSLFFCIW